MVTWRPAWSAMVIEVRVPSVVSEADAGVVSDTEAVDAIVVEPAVESELES
jgi:hypothetical protein